MVQAPVDDAFERLLEHLRTARGSDFTGYKRPSLMRLVTRRMRAVGLDSFDDYRDLLEVQPTEANALLDALLINVTAFFRDTETWELLREELLPDLLARVPADEPVRVWSAACATGEEAYGLAIVLHELLGHEQYVRRVKIYATDVDEPALAHARAGTYDAQALEPLGEARRDAYFEPEGERFRFRPDLRASLIFGRHDLLVDAPISRVLLLSCRNVLMYFTPESQTRVLERFSFALHPQGLLLLGKAEMLLTQSQLFVPVALPQRVFRARRTASGSRLAALAVGGHGGDVSRRRFTDAAFNAAPAAQVVLDERGVVLLINERAQRRLPLSAGDVGRPFVDLPLSYQPVELRGTVATVQASREPVELRDVRATPDAPGETHWDIRISPLQEEGDLLGVQLVFDDVSERHELRARLEQVHQELTTAYEELQSSSEELETTNEELQSAVEELETTNEELQSTNEELETMNEELQSTNEELQTLNDELRVRTVEVNQVNAFLESILTGLRGGVVVVDDELVVRVWNERAEQMWGLRDHEATGSHFLNLDIGLPVEALRDGLRQVLAGTTEHLDLRVASVNRFGRKVQCAIGISPLRSYLGAVTGAIVLMEENDGEPAA